MAAPRIDVATVEFREVVRELGRAVTPKTRDVVRLTFDGECLHLVLGDLKRRIGAWGDWPANAPVRIDAQSLKALEPPSHEDTIPLRITQGGKRLRVDGIEFQIPREHWLPWKLVTPPTQMNP